MVLLALIGLKLGGICFEGTSYHVGVFLPGLHGGSFLSLTPLFLLPPLKLHGQAVVQTPSFPPSGY